MYFITVQVLLIFMPYQMLLLEKMFKKEVLILKSWPDLACSTASVGISDFCYLNLHWLKISASIIFVRDTENSCIAFSMPSFKHLSVSGQNRTRLGGSWALVLCSRPCIRLSHRSAVLFSFPRLSHLVSLFNVCKIASTIESTWMLKY